jgi:transcriptional regulator with XRE-family HTH domain
MLKHLADHFRAARLAKGLTLEALARQTCYGRAKKTARRIARFERDGGITEELLARIADALDIDLPTIEELLAEPFPASYVVQGRADGRFLTPELLSWSDAAQDAQSCDLDKAKAIQGWLNGIGVNAKITKVSR